MRKITGLIATAATALFMIAPACAVAVTAHPTAPFNCGLVCDPNSGPLPTGFHWRHAPKHNGDRCIIVWAGKGKTTIYTCTNGYTKITR